MCRSGGCPTACSRLVAISVLAAKGWSVSASRGNDPEHPPLASALPLLGTRPAGYRYPPIGCHFAPRGRGRMLLPRRRPRDASRASSPVRRGSAAPFGRLRAANGYGNLSIPEDTPSFVAHAAISANITYTPLDSAACFVLSALFPPVVRAPAPRLAHHARSNACFFFTSALPLLVMAASSRRAAPLGLAITPAPRASSSASPCRGTAVKRPADAWTRYI